MKKMILLSAVPGAGKSTWAHNYERLNQEEKVFIVSSDEIRKELGGSYQYFKEEAKVWQLFLERANNFAREYEDVTVILDSTNLTNKYRKMYLESTPLFDKHILVYFDVSFERACERNLSRHEMKVVPHYAMERLYGELEPLDQETINLYDEYIEIKIA